jgi:hypothetical protein
VWYKKLEEKIEELRSQMEQAATVLGLGHPEVYRLSCKLDALHNVWERLNLKEKQRRAIARSVQKNSVFSNWYRSVI